jgi:hypothetical protein
MGLPLPRLDDRTYDDLIAEARSLIPAVQPEWTDHNASDPGITLLELIAWLTEMLIYRADQVPAEHVRAFLRLLNGPAWTPGADLDTDVADAVALLRTEWRAVTAADFERLAREASADVLSAHAVAHRDVSGGTIAERAVDRPAHLSVELLLADGAEADPDDVYAAVAQFLEPRRLVATRVVVTGPLWTPVAVDTLVAHRPDVASSQALAAARAALIAFLDARTGGPGGAGWAWGRSVYTGELAAVLEALPEIDYVVDMTLDSSCAGAAARCVPGSARVHDDGSLVALELGEGCLPGPDAATIAAAGGADFVPVTATVPIVVRPTVPPEGVPAVRAAVLRAVRDLTWPGRGWPPAGEPALAADQVAAAARDVPNVKSVGTVELRSDPARMRTSQQGIISVLVESSELIDLQVEVVG